MSIFYQRCLFGVTLVAFGFDTAFGAVMSEPTGADVVGVVSSELSPGENANVDGGVSPDFGIVADRDTGSFNVGARVRVAALSYEPSDLFTSVDVPKILSDMDTGLYRKIFHLQQDGEWLDADVLIGKLSDKILLGHVQFQRYMHPTAYRSKFEELAAWLEDYADLPDAYRIYRLAMKRRPEGAAAPVRAKQGYLSGYGEERGEANPIFPSSKAGVSQPKSWRSL